MKALITGISGFVGTHLAEHLLREGDQVLGCSRGGAWRDDAPPEIVERVELCAWDVSRPAPPELRRRLADFAPDAIYHLAALADPARCGSQKPLPEAVTANVRGTEHVVELALGLEPQPRLLLASSCHVYAPVDEKDPVVAESYPCQPAGGYGKTKLAAEEAVQRAVREHGLWAVVARAFHQAGPRQEPRYLLSEWCRALAAGENQLNVKNRHTWLDLSDVRDAVRAYRPLVRHGRAGGHYNVGSGVPRSSGQVLEALLGLFGRPVAINELSPGRRQEPIADCRALAAACGWKAETELITTLADTLEYWRRKVAALAG